MLGFPGLGSGFFRHADYSVHRLPAPGHHWPDTQGSATFGLVSLTTICLLASSGTIHAAESRLHEGRLREFRQWWAGTIVLGLTFLAGTAYEWWELITEHHLTISRNLFGTTFYTLVGFHGAHVTAGLIMMLVMFALALANQVTEKSRLGIKLVSWYWHFVDAVWIVVFTLVYVIGR